MFRFPVVKTSLVHSWISQARENVMYFESLVMISFIVVRYRMIWSGINEIDGEKLGFFLSEPGRLVT